MSVNYRLANIAAQLARLSEQLNALLAEQDIGPSTFEDALAHIIAREGIKLNVYLDTLGIPTVGVGHVIRPEDNLKIGDRITPERAYEFLDKDAKSAFEAASSQLIELGLNNSDFLVALTSVNFQLGTKWFRKFPKTWALIKKKKYEAAAKEVANSLWAKQTPVRVRDFQAALMKLRSN